MADADSVTSPDRHADEAQLYGSRFLDAAGWVLVLFFLVSAIALDVSTLTRIGFAYGSFCMLVLISHKSLQRWLEKHTDFETCIVRLPAELPAEAKAFGSPWLVCHTSRALSINLAFFGLVIGGFPVVLVTVEGLELSDNGLMAALEKIDKSILIYAVAGPLFAAAMLFIGLRNLWAPVAIVVFAEGLLRIQRGKSIACPWNDMESLLKDETGFWRTYTVRRKDSAHLHFSNIYLTLAQLAQLADLIEQKTGFQFLLHDKASYQPPIRKGAAEAAGLLPQNEIETLGEAQAIYRPDKHAAIKGQLFAWGAFGLGLAAIVFAVYFFRADGTLNRQAPLIAIGGLGLAMIGGAAYVFVHDRALRNLQIFVFSNGLVVARGAECQVFRWDDVESVWEKITQHYSEGQKTGLSSLYKIRRADGFEVVIPSAIKSVEELGATIRDKIGERLLPRAAKQYDEGQTVQFGQITVSRQGVGDGRTILPWRKFKGIHVNDGAILVNKDGEWAKWSNIKSGSVPNVFVFVDLVNKIIGIQA